MSLFMVEGRGFERKVSSGEKQKVGVADERKKRASLSFFFQKSVWIALKNSFSFQKDGSTFLSSFKMRYTSISRCVVWYECVGLLSSQAKSIDIYYNKLRFSYFVKFHKCPPFDIFSEKKSLK